MPKSTLVRLHAAGATHRELRLFSNASKSDTFSGLSGSDVSRFLVSAGVPPERASLIAEAFVNEHSASANSRAESVWARVVLETDPEYPRAFFAMPRRPFLLYVRWNFPEAGLSISVVWSRKASPYGKEVTARFVREFVRHGASIVSGGASWIDSAAHSAAMECRWSTVAFVWTGIDVDYPRANARLFDAIADSSWAVVSAFPPGAWPLAHHFPIRNALVACYSDGTLVTEAALSSWSLITAKLALDFWKEVFAVPWDVLRPGSLWANSLIRDGLAKCVSAPEDVICEFTSRISFHTADSAANPPDSAANPSAARIFSSASVRHPFPRFGNLPTAMALSEMGPSDPQALCERTGLPLERVLSELSELEIAGAAFSDLFGSYALKPSAP